MTRTNLQKLPELILGPALIFIGFIVFGMYVTGLWPVPKKIQKRKKINRGASGQCCRDACNT
jgi:lipopolysaccharide export LptBFGC system permease protein LptF